MFDSDKYEGVHVYIHMTTRERNHPRQPETSFFAGGPPEAAADVRPGARAATTPARPALFPDAALRSGTLRSQAAEMPPKDAL